MFEGKALNIGVAGNLEPVLKSDEQLLINFRSFHENRHHFLVRLKDPTADPTGKILFTQPASDGSIPLCVLSVALPEIDLEPRPTKRAADGVTPGLELRSAQLFPKVPGMQKKVFYNSVMISGLLQDFCSPLLFIAVGTMCVFFGSKVSKPHASFFYYLHYEFVFIVCFCFAFLKLNPFTKLI